MALSFANLPDAKSKNPLDFGSLPDVKSDLDFGSLPDVQKPSFGNVQAGVSAPASFQNVQGGAQSTSEAPDPYKQFTDFAAKAGNAYLNAPEALMEAGANFESQAYAIPAGGLARLGVTAAQMIPEQLRPVALPTPDEAQQAVTEALTYQPQSEEGKQLAQAAAYPFEKLAEGAQYLGEKTLEATGSPALATAVDTAVQLVPMAILGAGGERIATRGDRAARAATDALQQADAAGKPSWDATQDALQAIQESDSGPRTTEPGNLNISPEERVPPSPETLAPEDLGNAPVKKTESKISAPQSELDFQGLKDADTQATQQAAWGDFSQLPEASTKEAVSKEPVQPAPGGHDLFNDLVPGEQEAAPAFLGKKIPLSEDPTVTRDEMGYYYRNGELVGMPNETLRPRTPEEINPQRAEPTPYEQKVHDLINNKLNTADKAWDYLAKKDDEVGQLAKIVLDSKNPDRASIPIKSVSPEDLLTSKSGAEQLLGMGWKGSEKNSAPLGLYQGGKVYIRGAGFADHGLDRTVLGHELLHSELISKNSQLRKLSDAIGDSDTSHLHPKTQAALSAYRELDRTRDALANNPDFVQEKGVPMFYKHAVSNVDELTSVALTDPSFRRYLDNVKMGTVTAWSKIKDSWRKMLGIQDKDKRVLDHILEHTKTIINYSPEDVAAGHQEFPAAMAGERPTKADIDRQAKAAIDRGANPEAVQQRQMALYKQHGVEEGPAPTSTKNAVRDAERAAEGRDPIIKEAAQSNPAAVEAAKATLEKNPNRPNEIIARLTEEGPHNISASDEAVLLIHKAALRNTRDEASKILNDPAATEQAKWDANLTWNEMEGKINLLDQATEASGREWGRFGQLRQRMIKNDYTLDAMERKRRAAVGGRPLTPKEAKDVKSDHEEIQSAQAELDKTQTAIQNAHQDSGVKYTYENLVKEMSKQLKTAKKKGTFLETLKKNADESRDWFKKNLSRASAGVDPIAFFHLARIGAYHIANGAVKFKDWLGKMKDELGEHFAKMQSSMPAVFKAAKAQHELGATETKPRLRAKKELDPNNITHKDVYDLARAHVINGVHGEDAVMRAVHGDLKDHGLSERDVRRLFSEYGEAKFPSKEADKKELRELRALVQMQESIDRLKEGLPALKSGVQRDKATQLMRDKRRQLNDMLKEKEAQTGPSPEKLVAYQEMRARNLRNQIEDLQKEITTGEKKPPRKGTPPDSDEVRFLKAERDHLKDELKKIEEAKNPPPSPEAAAHSRKWAELEKQIGDLNQRIEFNYQAKKQHTQAPTSIYIEMLRQKREDLKKQLDDMRPSPPAIYPKDIHAVRNVARRRAIENQMAAIDARIKAGGAKPEKLKPSPDDAETIALKQQRDAKKAELQKLLDQQNPPLSPEEKYQAQRGKQIQRSLEDIYKRIQNDDYLPRKREIKELNKANQAAAYKLKQAKDLFNRHQFEIQLSMRPTWRKMLDNTVAGINLSRAVMTSWDLSATLRQGGFIAFGRPVMASKALWSSIKAMRSEENAYKVQREIEQRPNFYKYQGANLDLTLGSGHVLTKQEEQFMSRWLEHDALQKGQPIRNIGRRVKNYALAPTRASERAFRTYLNKLRADMFDTMSETLVKNGEKPTTDELKAIANYINVATGRGSIGKNSQWLVGMNTIFFAPRLVKSRFDLLTGQPLTNAHNTARTRTAIAKEYGRFLTGIAAVYGMGYLAHWAFGNPNEKAVEWDPRSANFGQIRFGQTFINPTAGLSQLTVLLGREMSGENKNQANAIAPLRPNFKPLNLVRETPDLRKPDFGKMDAASALGTFLRTKLAPVPGAVLDLATGKNLSGQPVTLGSEIVNVTVPMTFSNIYQVMQDKGVPATTALTIIDALGISVQQRSPNQKYVSPYKADYERND